jgi:hypothetical protein
VQSRDVRNLKAKESQNRFAVEKLCVKGSRKWKSENSSASLK